MIFLRLFLTYLAPFKLALPPPRNSCRFTPWEDHNLRLFTQAFATIYANYSGETVKRVVNVAPEAYLVNPSLLGQEITFPNARVVSFSLGIGCIK